MAPRTRATSKETALPHTPLPHSPAPDIENPNVIVNTALGDNHSTATNVHFGARTLSFVESPPPKRQKVEGESASDSVAISGTPPTSIATMDIDSASKLDTPSMPNTAKNAHLRGRKRFKADLADIVEACSTAPGFEMDGLSVRDLRAGEDEGSIEFEVWKVGPGQIPEFGVSIVLLVSDTSEYPRDHTFFSSSPTPSASQKLQNAIESLADGPSRSIYDAVVYLLKKLRPCFFAAANTNTNTNTNTNAAGKARAHPSQSQSQSQGKTRHAGTDDEMDQDQDQDNTEEEDEDEEYDPDEEYDHEFGIGAGLGGVGGEFGSKAGVLLSLQRDFLEIIAERLRPGYIPFGADSFAISISTPLLSLTPHHISPRALMAWDSRLLSPTKPPQHLTLLITGFRGCYPVLGAEGMWNKGAVRVGLGGGGSAGSAGVRFKVGVCGRYKPDVGSAREVGTTFGLVEDEQNLNVNAHPVDDPDNSMTMDDTSLLDADPTLESTPSEPESDEDPATFTSFSLSSSLESLLDQSLLKLIQLRRKFGLGWAGAEALLGEVERSQRVVEEVYGEIEGFLHNEDTLEAQLARTYSLPPDPLHGKPPQEEINLPLTAFLYLMRRLTLCTRYCLVCHNKLSTDFEALKPYVCDSKLCAYQYYSLNRGPSLEYEIITNPATVDLLVSIAYTAAAENVLDEPLPIGMGLRVPLPNSGTAATTAPSHNPNSYLVQLAATAPGFVQPPVAEVKPPLASASASASADGLVDFDDMNLVQMRASIAEMIDSLPPIADMRRHLQRKVTAGKKKPKLKDMDAAILPAAWSILRWCVASCTAYLEEMSPADSIQNVDPTWRQFRFSVGAPDAEAKFAAAVAEAQKTDSNAKKYPSLYAFHGSPLRNWHSIIRHGLWFRTVQNGRAFGHGVYLAKDASVSMGHYASSSKVTWRNSKICPSSCVALAEIVNLPKQFVSSNPYFVVQDTSWIVCRYLLVKGVDWVSETEPASKGKSKLKGKKAADEIPLVKLDPAHPVTLPQTGSTKKLAIPQPFYQLETLLATLQSEYVEEEHDEEDGAIYAAKPLQASQAQSQASQSDYYVEPRAPTPPPRVPVKNDWKHNADWVNSAIESIMPPPVEANPSATMAVQRELRTMLKEQEQAKSFKDLGWYMPPDLIGDNLFQWIVEMHSFDPDIPIAKDLKSKKVNSIIFEIRFPPMFPLAPPFFRILKPRFLPFIQGGGGHVTGGGSICMDLLTADGWLPSYSIAAILLQIKLAISNLDPRPARLASNWSTPYNAREALEGYKRAANAHGWQIPAGLDQLVS